MSEVRERERQARKKLGPAPRDPNVRRLWHAWFRHYAYGDPEPTIKMFEQSPIVAQIRRDAAARATGAARNVVANNLRVAWWLMPMIRAIGAYCWLVRRQPPSNLIRALTRAAVSTGA